MHSNGDESYDDYVDAFIARNRDALNQSLRSCRHEAAEGKLSTKDVHDGAYDTKMTDLYVFRIDRRGLSPSPLRGPPPPHFVRRRKMKARLFAFLHCAKRGGLVAAACQRRARTSRAMTEGARSRVINDQFFSILDP
jgi:hypothetical protein